MNLGQTLDSPLNIEEQTPTVVPIHVERALPLHRLGEARRQEDVSRRNVSAPLGHHDRGREAARMPNHGFAPQRVAQVGQGAESAGG